MIAAHTNTTATIPTFFLQRGVGGGHPDMEDREERLGGRGKHV
jgi:hypothetical protein